MLLCSLFFFFFFPNKVLSKNAVIAKKERKHAGKGQRDKLKDMLLITH